MRASGVGKSGNGKQSFWEILENPNSPDNYPFTFTELAEMGYIKIIIKDKPGGKVLKAINEDFI